jgi:CheY-like chemotaxis protein
LSQVYGFIRQSGGFVRMESQPELGTTVRLYLPRDLQAETEAPAHADTIPGRSARDAVGATVLVVEDEPEIRAQIVDALREAGCHVLQAANGPEGFAISASAEPIDLLITDVGLPGMNGRQVADAARATRPALPVLFITGYAGGALDESPLPPGMEVLRKPFDIETLVSRASRLLKESLAC